MLSAIITIAGIQHTKLTKPHKENKAGTPINCAIGGPATEGTKD